MAGGRQEGGNPLEGQDTRDGHETGVMVWGSG